MGMHTIPLLVLFDLQSATQFARAQLCTCLPFHEPGVQLFLPHTA